MLTAMLERPAVRRVGAALGSAVRRFPRAVAVVAALVTLAQARPSPAPSGASIGCSPACRASATCGAWARWPRPPSSTTPPTPRPSRSSTSAASTCRWPTSRRTWSRRCSRSRISASATHAGVDLVRILGATLANLREGRLAQGGSTLTQQLARQSFLTLDKTYTRKVQEVLLALRIEHQYTKDEILELYLNKMYFGAGLYGAEAAAMGYFGKPARELSVGRSGAARRPGEVALDLGADGQPGAGRGPPQRRAAGDARARRHRRGHVRPGPRQRGDAARRAPPRRAVRPVLQGTGAARADRALRPRARLPERAARLHDHRRRRCRRPPRPSVAKSLAELSTAAPGGAQGPQARRCRRTTRRCRRRWSRSTRGPDRCGPWSAAAASRESHFNRAVQAKRQPGSAFKPFVYAAALEDGYTPASLIDRLDEPFDTLQGEWSPEEGHASGSELTMRTALKTSSNRAAVRMLEMVGVSSAVDYAQKLGLGSVPAVPSLALGSGEVTLFDMTSAYGAFANAGDVAPAAAGAARRGHRGQRALSRRGRPTCRRSRPRRRS